MTEEATGQKVREIREKRGVSLNELARRSGVAKGNLSEIERGHKSPTVRTLRKIARGLDVSPRSLL